MEDLWRTIAVAAIVLTSVQLVPQLYRTFRLKQTRQLSYGLSTIIMTGAGLWIAYGLHLQDVPIVIANCINFAAAALLLAMKIRYSKRPK